MSWSSVCLVGEMDGVFFSMPQGMLFRTCRSVTTPAGKRLPFICSWRLTDGTMFRPGQQPGHRTPDKTSEERTSEQPWDRDASQWLKGWPVPAMCGILGKHQGARQKGLSRVPIDAR